MYIKILYRNKNINSNNKLKKSSNKKKEKKNKKKNFIELNK